MDINDFDNNPETFTVTREEFLKQREETMRKFREEKARLGNSKYIIIVDAGEEIICDYCNSDIEGNTITLVSYGHSAICEKFAKERK
jgi:hypothetical protein